MSAPRVVDLAGLDLESVRAHGGLGRIGFHRVLESAAFDGPWNFVDYAVIPPGASIGRHTHGDDEELYLILEGRGTMHVEGRDFPVRAGHVVLNPRGGTHGLVNDSDAPLRVFVVEVACGRRGASVDG
jgi:oxalate decarboxylase/phosphoglucose isomerase-like protein (cupin superfamily)